MDSGDDDVWDWDADEGVTQKVSPAPSQSLEVRMGVCA